MRIAKFCAILLIATLFCLAGAAAAQGQKSNSEEKSKADMVNRTETYCARLEKISKESKDLTEVGQKSGELMKALSEVAKASSEHLVDEFKNKGKDWKYRLLMLNQLSKGEVASAVDPVIDSLADSHEEIRAYSAAFLGKMKSGKAWAALIRTLDDKNRHVRIATAKALVAVSGNKAADALLQRFKKEDDFVTRTDFISFTFDKLPIDAVLQPLIKSLNDDSSPDVRAASARCLAAHKDKRALESLLLAVRNDKHPLVRYYAAIGIGEVGDKSQVSVLEGLTEKDDFVKDGINSALKNLRNK